MNTMDEYRKPEIKEVRDFYKELVSNKSELFTKRHRVFALYSLSTYFIEIEYYVRS